MENAADRNTIKRLNAQERVMVESPVENEFSASQTKVVEYECHT
jgi:hypothetical protein